MSGERPHPYAATRTSQVTGLDGSVTDGIGGIMVWPVNDKLRPQGSPYTEVQTG